MAPTGQGGDEGGRDVAMAIKEARGVLEGWKRSVS